MSYNSDSTANNNNDEITFSFEGKSELTKDDKDLVVVEYRNKARKLAKSILRKWHSRLDLEEINSVVDLSLCEAVKRYDPTRGASFITFLFYHLRGNLIRTISAAANRNGVPKAEDAENSKAGLSALDIAEALNSTEGVLPDEVLFQKELVRLTFEACDNLDSLEREVIQRIYLGEEQLNKVAASLGYSRCHISRVKKRALDVLNREMEHILRTSLGISKDSAMKMIGSKKIQRRKSRSKVNEDIKNRFKLAV